MSPGGSRKSTRAASSASGQRTSCWPSCATASNLRSTVSNRVVIGGALPERPRPWLGGLGTWNRLRKPVREGGGISFHLRAGRQFIPADAAGPAPSGAALRYIVLSIPTRRIDKLTGHAWLGLAATWQVIEGPVAHEVRGADGEAIDLMQV